MMEDKKMTEQQKKYLTIGGVILVIVVAIAAYFMNNGKVDTADTLGQDTKAVSSQVYDSTKDVAKEVPQALDDATTKGDQDTTRPNKDGSTDKLDQK